MTLAEPPLAAMAGFSVVAGVVAFLRWWGLIIEDSWLVPLMLAMCIQFVAESLLSAKLRTLNGSAVAAAITRKAMEVLAVAMGFTLQRMTDGDPTATPWGHFTMGAIIGYELYLFVTILRYFGLPVGPFEPFFTWLEATIGGPVRKAQMQAAKVEGKAEAAVDYLKSGEVHIGKETWAAIDAMDDPLEAPKPGKGVTP